MDTQHTILKRNGNTWTVVSDPKIRKVAERAVHEMKSDRVEFDLNGVTYHVVKQLDYEKLYTEY